jgi:hypothetical protein
VGCATTTESSGKAVELNSMRLKARVRIGRRIEWQRAESGQ